MPRRAPSTAHGKRRAKRSRTYSRRDIARLTDKSSHPGGTTKLVRLGNILPPRIEVPHSYTSYYVNASVSNAAASQWTFRINSLYDPEYDNNGRNAQPRGYDRMASAYGYYLVKKARIEIVVNAAPGSTPAQLLQYNCAAYPGQSGSSTPPGVNYLAEQPSGKQGMIGLVNGVSKKIVTTVNMKDLAGLTGNAFNSGLGALSGLNPGNPLWYTFALQAIGGGVTATANATILVKINYIAEWTLPKYATVNDDMVQPPDTTEATLPSAVVWDGATGPLPLPNPI